MQYLENKDIHYKGEIIDMFDFFKRKSTPNKGVEDQEKDESNKKDKIEELSLIVEELNAKIDKNNSKEKLKFSIELGAFILSLLTAFGCVFIYLDGKFSDINAKIDNCLKREDISELETSVSKIELWVEGDINDITKPGANQRIEKIEEKLNISPINVNNSIVGSNLLNTVSIENQGSNTSIIFTPEMYLGEDINGKKYNIEDIVEQTVLLTYNENDKEVYFLGQLNENYHWDGYCVTNTYNNDGTLYGICESNFDNGIRQNYKSFYMSNEEDMWIYTDRKCTEDGNKGISIECLFGYDKIKNFTNTNIRVYDMLYVKDFYDSDDKIIISYYYGLTNNGVYNDNSGDAYWINYFDPRIVKNISDKPVIRMLYKGKFIDGQPSDDSYDSWSISREIDTTYMYYKGGFLGGKANSRDRNKEEFENYLTHERINYYLQLYGFYEFSNQFITEYEQTLKEQGIN